MTENSHASNDCRFTYMLDFILKPGGKLAYQDNASLLMFKRNPSIDTYRKSRWKKDLTSSKELLLTTRTSNFAR